MTWQLIVRITPLAIGVVAVAIVLGSVYVDMQDTSPGRLAAVHAQHTGLTGPQNCAVCHGQPGQSMSSACLSCHEDIGVQLPERTGFHGQMSSDLVADCAKCHSEHHGEDFSITNERSFALAGVSDLRLFQHQGSDFHLVDKHLSISCEKCHEKAHVELLSIGEKRFLGLSQNCTSCHKDDHDGSFGQDCASCHGQQHPFRNVAQFEHTQAFALSGAHGKAACADCHEPGSLNSVAKLFPTRSQATEDSLQVRNCRVCHASPHKEQFLAAVSHELNLAVDNSCQHCHPAIHETFVGPLATLDSHQHACTGFALEAPHDKLACSACHTGFGKKKPQLVSFRQSYPGRHPDDCRACHGDPHQGQFELGPFRGADCLACHQRHTFVPSAFTLVHHNQTRFPLVDAHSFVACNECHVLSVGQVSKVLPNHVISSNSPTVPEASRLVGLSSSTPSKPAQVRIFHGTPTSCKGCHNDPHRGQFEYGPFRGSDCRVCHDEHSFRQPMFTIEQHAKTRFPLTGAHRAVACNTCHRLPGDKPSTDKDAIDPRIFRGTSSECSACHADVHNGQFDQPHLPASIVGNTGCARCHSTESFQQIRAEDFDHAFWTGYELRGAHARTRCTDCHWGSRAVSATGRTFGHVTSRNCQSCHSDPHVGQFGPTAKVNCTQCHVEGNSFRELVFDHQRQSRFRLDRDHASLACSTCHKPQRLPGGGEAVRYKPLGAKCENCHVPRGPRKSGLRN